MDFELLVYFTEKHYSITTIKAATYEDAEILAYKKFRGRNIKKIEPYTRGRK